MMEIEFFGVRGSVPVSSKDTTLFGGSTSSVLVTNRQGNQLILDSGTGIIVIGDLLVKNESPIVILLTHNHWDHIQGFPFFRRFIKKEER